MAEQEDLGELSVRLTAIDASFKASMGQVSQAVDKLASKMGEIPTEEINANFKRLLSPLEDMQKHLGGLRAQLTQGVAATRGLGTALAALGGTGKVSADTIGQLLSFLPLLSNPALAAGAAIGGVATAIYKTAAAAQEAKDKALAEELKRIEEAANLAATGLRAYRKALVSGASRREAHLTKERTQLEANAEAQNKLYDKAIAKIQEFIETKRGEQKAIRDAGEISATDARKLGELEIAIDNAAFAIAKLTVEQDRYVEMMAAAGVATKDQEEELKRATKAADEYRKALEELQKKLGPAILGGGITGAGEKGPTAFGQLMGGGAAAGAGSSGGARTTAKEMAKNAFLGGGLAGNVAQGAMQAGPLGALAALAISSKGFQEALDALNGALQPVANLIGAVFEPLAPIFQELTTIIEPLVSVLSPLIGLVFQLQPGFILLRLSLNALSFIAKSLFYAMRDVAIGMLRIVKKVADAVGISSKGLNKALKALEDATWGATEGTEEMAGETGEFNIPSGYKVALRRFQAMSPESTMIAGGLGTSATSSGMTSAGAGGGLHIGPIYITSNDPEEIWRRIERVIERKNTARSGGIVPSLRGNPRAV